MNPTLSPETPEKIPPRLVTSDDASADAGAAATGDADGVSGTGQPLKVKKRGKFWKGLGLTLLLGTTASAAYLTQTKHGQKVGKLWQEEVINPGFQVLEAKQNPELIFQQANSDVVNILLVGRDQNYKQVYKNGINVAHTIDHDTPARSDTMIVVSLDRLKKTVRMVSFPRDALVHMPPNKYDVELAKLNAAHAYGGVNLLKKTLHDELGLTIHHHAVIKFDGFMKLVDEVGGVYVDVIGALKKDGTRGDLRYKDTWAIPPLDINLKPGKQWLSGEQAHAYVRFRMDEEGDPGRIRRQQAVMRALARKLKELPPLQVPSVMKMIREQFETDMGNSELASAGFFAQGLGDAAKMQPITLYGSYTSRGSIKLNRRRNRALLTAIFGPTFNPDNFLPNSPSVRGWEFGPDETKADTRDVLREAGLIEGEPPRIATSSNSSAALNPNGFSSSPSPFGMPSNSGALAAPRDPFAFTRPEVTAPESVPATEERPRRIRRTERRREEVREEPRREEVAEPVESAPALQPEPLSVEAREPEVPSPLPEPESNTSNDELSVESPIPQPE